MASEITLQRRPQTAGDVLDLDAAQRQVVEHGEGPLLVLAGPGTGKTTTLVEAVVERIAVRGVDPSQVLALTSSRKAAEQLRDRITARLGRTISSPVSMTFHAFAHGLVRRFTPAEIYTTPLRLLSAPQADVLMHELLELHRGELGWPESLGEAVSTRGFAGEVATVINRARERGADDADLIALGRAHREAPEILAAGLFLRHYLDSLDDHGAIDYADLVRRAVIEAREHGEELQSEFRYIFVDEYQDTDPGQVELLTAMAGGGHNLVVLGDPQQSIYGFRGAEVRGILEFPDQFRTRAGEPAPVVVLDTSHRMPPEMVQAAARVTANLSLPVPVPAGMREPYTALRPRPGLEQTKEGQRSPVEVFTFDSERAEAERVADLLRRAHFDDGVAWDDMAIMVRQASVLPTVRRLLTNAGVPVEVAADETPLGHEPAVQPLLAALEVVTRSHASEQWTPTRDTAEALFLSPLGGLGVTQLRVLARALRRREVAVAAQETRAPASSGDLMAAALVDVTLLDDLDEVDADIAERARHLVVLLANARAALAKGADVETVLWSLWEGTSWGERLREAVMRGGLGAPRAHRDLDAVVALFGMAAKAQNQRGRVSPLAFLDEVRAEAIPADSLADKGVRSQTVRLLTIHRSKGLEWELVVIMGVQEGAWPDLRRRSTLLGADRVGDHGYGQLALVPDTSGAGLLAEERRLFHVACTRARTRLVVTSVFSRADDGLVPSRFVAELCTTDANVAAGHRRVVPVHVAGRPERPLTLDGLVSELRRVVVDTTAGDEIRDEAARRLAALAAQRVDGRPLVPAADPANWWGTAGLTRNRVPVRPADAPVKLSASTVQSIADCPARWFLEREAGGSAFSGEGAAFGNVVHKVAEHVATPAGADADIDELMELVDEVWGQLPFKTPWARSKERENARAAITRFLNAHRSSLRDLKGTEVPFSFVATLPDGVRVALRGFADRLEVDGDGRVVVVDLKTNGTAPSTKSLETNPQLAIYQYAAEQDAFADLLGPGARSGGAELWQLRDSTKDTPKVQAQATQVRDDEGWFMAERQLAETARVIREEAFDATPGAHCRFCSFAVLCPAQTTSGVVS